MRYAMDEAKHAAIFGPKDDLEPEAPGRSRKCKVCGGWHSLSRPWPHNCREPAPPRNRDLAAPRIAPSFEPFKTGMLETAEVIGSRGDKREYMKRNDLVEYDEGVSNPADHWTEAKRDERELGELISTISQTDTEYLTQRVGFDVSNPERVDEAGTLDAGTEISTDIEVAT